jgi:phage shock protein A
MFESLRQAFREAIENFHTELNRDTLPEATDRLLSAMSGEVVDARQRLEELRREIDRVRKESAQEEESARTCVRREEMARGIGDTETEQVARQFALRHLRRKEVLDRKVQVLAQEVRDRELEVEDMMVQLKEARTRREAMGASASRTEARESLREADDLFLQLDRMEERIREIEARAGAAQVISDLDLEGEHATWGHHHAGSSGTSPSQSDVNARLEELKRRMASESPG